MNRYEVFLDGKNSVYILADKVWDSGGILYFEINKPVVFIVAQFIEENICGYVLINYKSAK